MGTGSYRPGRLVLLREGAIPGLGGATSPGAFVTPTPTPFFLWHTAEHPYVPPEHTYRLASSLASQGVPHTTHVFAHGPHSLGLAQGASDAAAWTTLAATWISEQRSTLNERKS